jgi:hypothetical protein
MNLQYLKETNPLNQQRARWAETLQEYNFKIIYRKGTGNGKADALSRCLEFTAQEGGTTSMEKKPLLGPEFWTEIGVLHLEEKEDYKEIVLAEFSVVKLTSTMKEHREKEVKEDGEYQKILCKVTIRKQNVDERFGIDEDRMLVWKGRLYVPNGFRKKVMEQEHDSRVAGHFRRDRTLELFTRNFYCPKLEDDVRKYCNKCNCCQQTKSPRSATHGLLHPLELPSSP